MTTVTFDTLALVDKLKTAGFDQKQAEAVIRVIADAQDALATKDDLKHEIEFLRRDLKELEQRIIIKLGALITLAIGVVAALVKLL